MSWGFSLSVQLIKLDVFATPADIAGALNSDFGSNLLKSAVLGGNFEVMRFCTGTFSAVFFSCATVNSFHVACVCAQKARLLVKHMAKLSSDVDSTGDNILHTVRMTV